jgi:hypothetical protein
LLRFFEDLVDLSGRFINFFGVAWKMGGRNFYLGRKVNRQIALDF